MTADRKRRGPSAASLGAAALFSVAALPIAFMACGGETKPAVAPEPAAPTVTASAPPMPTAVPTVRSDVNASAKAAYSRGYTAYFAGDLASAKAAFLEASRSDGTSAAPLTALGNVLEHSGDTSGALQQYKAALAVKSDDVAAIGAYAMCLANSGQTSQADAFLTSQHTKHPDSAPIATFLSEVKSLEGDTASAQQLAQDALRINPDFKPAMVAIAHDHYRAHRMELARYALDAVLVGQGPTDPARDKDNADAHLISGLMYEGLGARFRVDAMNDYDAARKSRPDSVEALLHLGVMKLQAGNVLEATPLLESAVKFAPNVAAAHLNLADAYRLAGRVVDSKREFDNALSKDSSLSMAHYDIGLLYLFSPSVPGTTALDQVATAIRELEMYRTMRGPKAGVDDVDELLTRAQAKQADLKVSAATAAATPPPASSSKPASSASSVASKPASPPSPPPAASPAASASGSSKPSAAPSGSAKPGGLAAWPADSAKR